jgi:threonine/homoserine/homoserine lactone efflux protein
MEALQNFLFAFVFSFVGSIPPGTLNLTVLQLGLEKKMNIAWRFALAAALIEYPYAWLAVAFENLITSSPVMLDNFKLITALVMTLLGIINLWSAQKPTAFAQNFQASGFRRGVILSVLNPLAIPFWIAITAYLSIQGWVVLDHPRHLHSYLFGISMGALVLLISVAYLAKRMVSLFQPGSKIKLIPGLVLLVLGLYAFIDYLF